MRRWLGIAGIVMLGLIGSGVAWWLSAGASPVSVDEVGDQVQTVRRGQMPIFAGTPEVAVLYRFATEHPEAFVGVECTCGCARIGHATNRFCYVKAEASDQVTYTSHAAT